MRKIIISYVAAIAVAASLAITASASADYSSYASHYGPMYAGQTHSFLPYQSNWDYLSGYSDGSAFTGVWFAYTNGQVSSKQAFCSLPGCVARSYWYKPNLAQGYPTIHNHGNASPSYFSGVVGWSN